MIRFGKGVVKHRILIFILSILLLVPSLFGMLHTRVNYDILSYLPKDIETMVGQDILKEEFGTGAFSLFIVDGMPLKDVVTVKDKIEIVEHVKKVIWYDSLSDISIPITMLPEDIRKAFNSDTSTMMAIIFDDTTSSDETMNAIHDIRSITNNQCFLSGMSAVVTDTKGLSEKETPLYVCIAVLLSSIVLAFAMDSYLVPVLFLLSIGMAILYNLGSNIFLGEISYITKALSAVLQLGVTMDYSIFLWHSFQEQQARYPQDDERAMAHAISRTLTSIVGSSVTTVAGFAALCFMSFTLGMDLGIVMAKGVILGVITCVTILPSLILILNKPLKRCMHPSILPDFTKLSNYIVNHYVIFAIMFVVLMIPAIYGNNHTKVYYNLDETLPKDLESIIANNKLKDDFDMNSTHMVLVKSQISSKDMNQMNKQLKSVDGVKWVLGLDALIGPSIPQSILPESILKVFKNEDYQIILVGSQFKVASNEVNSQVDELNSIVKSYDYNGMLVGEAPCTKDLIDITDTDFKIVSIVSIGIIFLIIGLVFRSISLPVILISVIELAIFINMGIPYYTGVTIPFIASIVIGTIQLGATIDYAILMTERYRRERSAGHSKKESVFIAHNTSTKSIVISALSFFAATFGVGLYSKIDMISSLCTLMARGAIISLFVVIFILPAMFMVFDRLICLTSHGFGPKNSEPQNIITRLK